MKKWVKILLAAAAVFVLFYTFYFLWNKTRPKKVIYNVVVAERDTISRYVIATGKVNPRDEVEIKPQISGIISTIEREAGERVTTSDLIATIKIIPEASQLTNAEAAVTRAQISLEQTEREFNRTKELYQANVVSKEEYEQVETSLKTAREDLQTANDNLEITRSGSTARTASSSNTQIRSTIHGMILDVPIKVGNSVIQANTFNDGTTIAVVADMNDMIFEGNVDETEVGRLVEGMPVELTIGAMQDIVLRAELEYISPKAIESNGVIMFEVKAAVKDQGDLFVRAGYSANASILVERKEDVLTIPESALNFENESNFVYIYTGDDGSGNQMFERRDITIGLSDGIKVEVLEGLQEGDQVRGTVMSEEDIMYSQQQQQQRRGGRRGRA